MSSTSSSRRAAFTLATAALALALTLPLAGCCPDDVGNRACFSAGPETAPAYTISAVSDCPAADVGMIYPPRMFTGQISVVATGPDATRSATPTWLTTRLLPALRAQHLAVASSGMADVCATAHVTLFITIESWFPSDRVVRAVAAQLAADQLQGEVVVVVQPPSESC